MCVKPDHWIRWMAEHEGLIQPFAEPTTEVNGGPVVSFGVTSYGYDARLDYEFKVPFCDLLDPHDIKAHEWREIVVKPGQCFVLLPHGVALARTMETFRIPRDIQGQVLGKSTYARVFLGMLCTPLEPGWEGTITLELVNTSNTPLVLWPGEGICQVIFQQGDGAPEVDYSQKRGKYQHQTAVQVAKL